ncbi:FAD-dependent oxidoreductase [Herbiconiux sp. VKM Ac-1786]|uniref:FAD-dependent oxidoreductase n=1 Tax=Herbiconiux sp. VKM Ac-1786 TaxID=2783824 RepID=UPI00188D3825|nr:FAD-dependent oxidoreductase [Herbiconiux sp. VKM Ac-1786]MBF4573137.1 FAD-dependent oxidoreductase [Herbiconiux sp. VKM Ac-1786]
MTAAPSITDAVLADRYDLIVVGAGACGLVAALAASDAGCSVVVLEKLDSPGGNTTLSTGSVPGAGTRFQREAGIEDSPARMVEDLLRTSGPHDAEHLVELMAETSAEVIEWLVDDHDIGLHLITDYKHVGHSVARLHAPSDRNGANLTADLVRAVSRAHVPIVTGTPVTSLTTSDGRVTGVVAETPDGPRTITAGAVVLASNGFGADRSLLRELIPAMADAPYHGAAGSTGEGIAWAQQLGAPLANATAYQAYAAVATDEGDILSWTTVERGAVIVGPDGRRLGDESVGYSDFAGVIAAQTPESFAVMDERIHDYVARHEPRFVKIIDLGRVQRAADLDELAALIGCDVSALGATLDAAATAASGTAADEFGRTDFGTGGALQAPYFVCRTHPAMFHTQGGVSVDRDARVLDGAGEAIPGLYAGGGVAAGISGREGAGGYASGNGLSTAVGLGYAAGRHVGATTRAD